MSDIYEGLGIRPMVNAWGPMTRFGGGIMAPEVADAMRAATQHSIVALTAASTDRYRPRVM